MNRQISGDRRPRDNVPEKRKFIQKRFEDNRGNFRDNRPRRDLRDKRTEKPKPQFEKKDDGEKLFRTLKVMGLSPEFSNDDLYVHFLRV